MDGSLEIFLYFPLVFLEANHKITCWVKSENSKPAWGVALQCLQRDTAPRQGDTLELSRSSLLRHPHPASAFSLPVRTQPATQSDGTTVKTGALRCLSAALSGYQSDSLQGIKNDNEASSILNGRTFAEVLASGPAHWLLLQPPVKTK